MSTHLILLLLAATLAAGCATAVSIPPPRTDHPANPEAAAAPLPPPSETLAMSDAVAPATRDSGSETQPGETRHGTQHMQHATGDASETKHQTPPTQPAVTTTPTNAPSTAAATYVCPMHPDVISDQPGRCPKCRMKLVPATETQGRHGGHR